MLTSIQLFIKGYPICAEVMLLRMQLNDFPFIPIPRMVPSRSHVKVDGIRNAEIKEALLEIAETDNTLRLNDA